MDCENSVEGVGSKAGWPQPIDLFPAALCHMPLTAKPHLLTLLLRDFWGHLGRSQERGFQLRILNFSAFDSQGGKILPLENSGLSQIIFRYCLIQGFPRPFSSVGFF